MKLIIAGSRTVPMTDTMLAVIDWEVANAGYHGGQHWRMPVGAPVLPVTPIITEVVCGMAQGGDQLGIQWARAYQITLTPFYPDWRKYGNAAGPIRNRQMADYADALIALWDGESRGTANMIEEMKKLGKSVHVCAIGKVLLG